MLVGSDDGVYRVRNVNDGGAVATERVHSSGRVLRLRSPDGFDGAFAATETGLYYAPDGEDWTDLDVPRDQVYAVGAGPAGDRLYAGTRPAHVYVAALDDAGRVTGSLDWRDCTAVREHAARDDWGIERHDDRAQVRDVLVPSEDPARVVVGVEVGGVYVSDDRGETWARRAIEGVDAPHTDDVHHVAVEDADTLLAATGSGLYRTADAGRTWHRLDADRRQSYFREAFVADGVRYAGGSPTPPSQWTEDRDHELFACRDGETLDALDSPVPDEVAVGWTATPDGVVAVTNRGTVLRRDDDWERAGSVPVPEAQHGRCVPLASLAD